MWKFDERMEGERREGELTPSGSAVKLRGDSVRYGRGMGIYYAVQYVQSVFSTRATVPSILMALRNEPGREFTYGDKTYFMPHRSHHKIMEMEMDPVPCLGWIFLVMFIRSSGFGPKNKRDALP